MPDKTGAPRGGAARLRRTSVLAAGKTSAQAEFTSAEHLNHRRAEAAFGCRSPKRKDFRIGSPFSLARGNNPNPLRLSAVLLEEYPIGLLVGGAFAPYKRFAAGKTLAQGQFTCPEHF